MQLKNRFSVLEDELREQKTKEKYSLMRIQYVYHLKEDLKFLQVDNQKMAKSYNKKRENPTNSVMKQFI